MGRLPVIRKSYPKALLCGECLLGLAMFLEELSRSAVELIIEEAGKLSSEAESLPA